MTRKDYQKLADALRACKPNGPTCYSVWLSIVHDIAAVLASDNDRFDLDRFKVACGITLGDK